MDTSILLRAFESILDRDEVTERARAVGAFVREREIKTYDVVLALLRAVSTGPSRTIASVRMAWQSITGRCVTPSSFDARLNSGLLRLLWELLAKVLAPTPRALRRRWPRALQQLRDIILVDGSRMALDPALAGVFRGTDDDHAALKLMTVFSMDQGTATDLRAGAAVHHDRRLLRLRGLLPGALYLTDLGFYDHELFARYDDAGAFFISRLKSNVVPRIEHVRTGVVRAREAVGAPGRRAALPPHGRSGRGAASLWRAGRTAELPHREGGGPAL